MESFEQELIRLRNQIDAIDREIISKLQERTEVVAKVGELKNSRGEAIYRPDREKSIYEKIKKLNQDSLLSDQSLFSIYREIISASIRMEKRLKIGYLGPRGSFSHLAVRTQFGNSIDSEDFSSIPEVFRAVESGKCDYGVVPIENSTEGTINSTLDLLMYSDLYIYSETYIKISMHLLGYEPDLSKINTLYGFRIANSQCRDWIQRNLPHCEIIETTSTSMAARILSEKKDGYAIGSSIAADIYALNIIRDNIEDMPNNSTRFFIIGKDQCPPTGNDKTTIVFSTPDQPGSLYSILKPFVENNINLTSIESRPTRKKIWEYNFFMDFNGHKTNEIIIRVLEELKKNTIYFRVIGSYPKSEPLL